MLALILALAAAAVPPAEETTPPSRTLSPVTVSPIPSQGPRPPADVKIDMGGSNDDDIAQPVVIWPAGAYQTRKDGRVVLRCDIDVHGLAQRCAVIFEAPAGHGFGHAAQEMRPTFKLPPTLGPDGQPVAAVKNISLFFKAPQGTFSMQDFFAGRADTAGMPRNLRKVIELDDPVWVQAASFDDLAAAYPANGDGAEGYAVARCQVARSGVVAACQTMKELPEGHGFGDAALRLAVAKFRISPQTANPFHRDPVLVDVAIRFQPPGKLDRTIMAPVWLAGIDPKATPQLFPPEAVASGLTTGRGIARCTVGPDGGMTACVPEPGEPDGLGFSEAAAKLASGMKMNLWGADAAPVVGGVVHIPIRLNLKGS
jgi:hypothetical protein